MSYLLNHLKTKQEIDAAIVSGDNVDKVVILRFGKETDLICMQMDDIVSDPDHHDLIVH